MKSSLDQGDLPNSEADPTQYTIWDDIVNITKRTHAIIDEGTFERPVVIVEDDRGERYVQLKLDPRKQRLASFILKPAVHVAQVIIDPEKTYDDHAEGKPIPLHYSHMIDARKIQAREGHIGLKTDMLLSHFILSDNHRNLSKCGDGTFKYHNVFYEDEAHYLFDFHASFDEWGSPVKMSDTEKDQVLPKLVNEFNKLFPGKEEKNKALTLLKEKICLMKANYSGDEGLNLIRAMCKRIGYGDDNLSDINQNWSEKGSEKLHQYLLQRIEIIEKFIDENYKDLI